MERGKQPGVNPDIQQPTNSKCFEIIGRGSGAFAVAATSIFLNTPRALPSDTLQTLAGPDSGYSTIYKGQTSYDAAADIVSLFGRPPEEVLTSATPTLLPTCDVGQRAGNLRHCQDIDATNIAGGDSGTRSSGGKNEQIQGDPSIEYALGGVVLIASMLLYLGVRGMGRRSHSGYSGGGSGGGEGGVSVGQMTPEELENARRDLEQRYIEYRKNGFGGDFFEADAMRESMFQQGHNLGLDLKNDSNPFNWTQQEADEKFANN